MRKFIYNKRKKIANYPYAFLDVENYDLILHLPFTVKIASLGLPSASKGLQSQSIFPTSWSINMQVSFRIRQYIQTYIVLILHTTMLVLFIFLIYFTVSIRQQQWITELFYWATFPNSTSFHFPLDCWHMFCFHKTCEHDNLWPEYPFYKCSFFPQLPPLICEWISSICEQHFWTLFHIQHMECV